MTKLVFSPSVPVAVASTVTGSIVAVFLNGNKPLPAATAWLEREDLLDQVVAIAETLGVSDVRQDIIDGRRLLLVNLGTDTPSENDLRSKGETIAKTLLQKLDNTSVSVIAEASQNLPPFTALRALAFGLVSGQYSYSLKQDAAQSPNGAKFYLVSGNNSPCEVVEVQDAVTEAIAAGIQRTLIDTPPNLLGVDGLVQAAEAVAADIGDVDIRVLRGDELAEFGLLNAVARASGAHQQPAVVVLTYDGNDFSTERTVLVGKGLVFDTGGVNLKPDGGRGMKADMGGSAVALSTFYSVAKRARSTNLTVVLGIARNDIGPNAYAPDDVYRAYNGKTVEIHNTDAEGRLVLADCLAYAEANLEPTRLITVATLTGAKLVALGEEYAAALSLDQSLATAFIEAANATGELAWQLPLSNAVHKRTVTSPVADVVNASTVSRAGTSAGAYFLTCFVDKVPFLHLDVAGTVGVNKPAWGVRALTQLIDSHSYVAMPSVTDAL